MTLLQAAAPSGANHFAFLGLTHLFILFILMILFVGLPILLIVTIINNNKKKENQQLFEMNRMIEMNKERSKSETFLTKKCPYCGEEIQWEAKKCKHCGEWLEEKQ